MLYDYERYMKLVLRLARKALGNTSPNPLVGALVVNGDEIVGWGYHKYAGAPHAEVEALRSAGEKSRGGTLYVNLEPCCSYGRTPPCTEAIINAGIKRVIFGVLDPNPRHKGAAVEILRSAGIDVVYPVLEEECRKINESFFKWISTGMPFMQLKLALSLDAKIADYRGESKWITSEQTRKVVQRLRLESDAIMIGSETLRKDRPSLTVRDYRKRKQPLRIVLSSEMTLAEARSLFSEREKGGEIRVISANKTDELKEALKKLAEEGITNILVEGGGILAASLLERGLIDKIHLHYAPIIIGEEGYGALDISPRKLSDCIRVKGAKIAKCGEDFIFTGYLS